MADNGESKGARKSTEEVKDAVEKQGLKAGKVQDTEILLQHSEEQNLAEQAEESEKELVAVKVNPRLRADSVVLGETFEPGKVYYVEPKLLEAAEPNGTRYLVEVE